MITCLGKSCLFGLICICNCACLSCALVKFCVFPSFPFRIEGEMWDVIVLFLDHCLSIFSTVGNHGRAHPAPCVHPHCICSVSAYTCTGLPV